MTTQETIEIIKTLVPKTCKMVNGRLMGGFDDWDSDKGKALKMAIDALKKQEAKNTVRHDNCGNRSASERCPVCFEMVNDEYCSNCGQKLNWR